LFEILEQNVKPVLNRDPDLLADLIHRCCEIKAQIVAQDEREETGTRAALNFGHTVAHAIEAVAGYDGPYKHGEAVAIGMVAECRIAECVNWVESGFGDRIASLLSRFGLPISAPGLRCDVLIDAMTHDKKNRAGIIRFVLPRRMGCVELSDDVRSSQLHP